VRVPQSALGRNRWSLTHLACAVGEQITVLKPIRTEVGLTGLASNASSAAIQVQWNASSHRACKLTCPHRNAQGFFSGLTKLSEDELKNGKGKLTIKDTGSLHVRTPHSRARAHACQ
jgi:hypothetical protein